MSRFTRYATTSQTLSLTAMEEASRRGLRVAGLEDLFLALVLSDQLAGRILRERGITIHTARSAVEECQKEQIKSLGITANLPTSGNIVFHETRGYEWSKRASDLIGRAGKRGRTADAAAVLRELMREPSGQIADLLRRLDTTPAAILADLERSFEEPTTSSQGYTAATGGGLAGSNESFVPSPVEDVWSFLSDPDRIPEWEPAIGTIEGLTADRLSAVVPMENAEEHEEHHQEGTRWAGHARTSHPNGKPIKVKEKFRRRTITLGQIAPRTHLAWEFTYPDSGSSPRLITAFTLSPTAGGTHLTTTMTWPGRQGWRSRVARPLRPLQRFLIWIRLSQISGSISRSFRQA
ncbi:SRPBCC family protein [Arthrobacter sp. TMT4-20]